MFIKNKLIFNLKLFVRYFVIKKVKKYTWKNYNIIKINNRLKKNFNNLRLLRFAQFFKKKRKFIFSKKKIKKKQPFFLKYNIIWKKKPIYY